MSDFTWTSDSGTEITLSPMSSITAGMLRKYRKLDEMDFMFSILEDVIAPDELAKVDELPLPEVERMFRAWQANEGATVPQS